MNMQPPGTVPRPSLPVPGAASLQYSAALPAGLECAVTGEIPRLLHFIWLGGKPLPAFARSCIESWREEMPEWEIDVWHDRDVEKLPLANRSLFRAARNFGEASDMLRYELLAQFGGLYVDVDMECLQDVSPLLEGVSAFAGCSRRFVESAILGGSAGHPFWERVVQSLPLWYAQHRGDGAVICTGPRYLEAMARLQLGDAFSLGGYERNGLKLFEEKVFYATEGGYTRHHWRHSWMEVG